MLEHVGNTNTRLIGTSILGTELVTVIFDARWMLIALIICIIADFRYGWGESSLRHKKALEIGNLTLADKYKWRTSRAVRRSVNKAIDYLVWVSVGMAAGMAILPRLGIDYTYGGICASIVAIMCEGKSIVGHFIYLHGITIEERTIKGFVKAFTVALIKRKSEVIGDAIESGFNNIEDKKEDIKEDE